MKKNFISHAESTKKPPSKMLVGYNTSSRPFLKTRSAHISNQRSSGWSYYKKHPDPLMGRGYINVRATGGAVKPLPWRGLRGLG